MTPGTQALAAAIAALALTLSPSISSGDQGAKQRNGGGQSGGSRAGGGHQPSGTSPRSGAPADQSARRRPPSGGSLATTPRTGSAVTPAGDSAPTSPAGADDTTTTTTDAVPQDGPHSPRDRGQPVVGRAEPRRRGPSGGGTTIAVPVGIPWGYGGYGWIGYYGDYYDPWLYPPDPVVAAPPREDGALRLKVKPKEAWVFVDGYFAGVVDDFDGVFQRLRLEPGPHRIEISADGYETLTFDVQAQPDQTITYKGTLTVLP
jgi:hypothetical protein